MKLMEAPCHNPPSSIVIIDSIEVNKHGKVRRAKLYYLRKLTGKKARIAEKKTVTKGAE